MSHLARGTGAALVLATLIGCPAPSLQVAIAPPAAEISAVAVLPTEIGYVADPGESVRRTHDVLDALWTQTTWRVLGPKQFRLLHEDQRDLLTATDLVVRGQKLGFDPRHAAVLRTRVSMREAHGAAVVSGGEEHLVGRDYQGKVDATVELRDMSGAIIAEIHVEEDVDPFAERPDWDHLPAARIALRRGLTALRDGCPSCFASGVRPPFDLFQNPAAVLDSHSENGNSLRQEILAAGGPEGDVKLWNALQYMRPDIALAEAKRLAGVPPSACIGARAPEGLEPGDCIIAVDGQTIWGPHGITWALAKGGEVALTIIDTVGSSRIVLLAAP